jgi:hypothetical protein
MPESAQKFLNSVTVNWVPLSVMILLGMPNLYMISLMISTALAAVIDATGFTFIHFVNLSTTMKICVNPPLALLNGPTRSSPHVEKAQVIGMIHNWWDDTCFWQAKNLQPSHLGSRGRTWQWAERPPTYLSSQWVTLHPCECHKSLNGCLARWHILHLG